MQGVGSEGQGRELKRPFWIKGIDLYVDYKDLAAVMDMVKARKKKREEKEK